MRLRTFTAPDIATAMRLIRTEMGEEAIIISSMKQPGGAGITVTAAMEQSEPEFSPGLYAAPAVVEPQVNLALEKSEAAARLIERLRFHNLPSALMQRLANGLDMLDRNSAFGFAQPEEGSQLEQLLLAQLLENCFGFDPLPLHLEGTRVLLVGQPGAGKTLTIAKMAAQLVMQHLPVTVITTDNKRAGGVEQLSAFTDILGLELKVASNKGELWKLLQQSNASDRMLIDSGGCNPYDAAEMKELEEQASLASLEPVFVTPSGADATEAEDVAMAFKFTGCRRLIVTRTDTARRFGSVLAAAYAGGYSFCNVSSTARIVGEFRVLDAASLANLLLQHQHQP